jgi:hypothetical protein
LTTEEIDIGGIVMDMTETVNGVVPQSVFEEIEGKDSNLRLNGITDQGRAYSIIFNGLDITEPLDFNMQINESSDNSDDIAKLADNAWILHFDQEGILPGTAMVEIETTLDESLSYMLFYYDETLMQASYEQKVNISDGKIRFTVDHCSDYFIAQRAIADSLLNTGFRFDLSPMALTYIVVGILLLAAAVGVLLRRRGVQGGKSRSEKKQKKLSARKQIAARKKVKAKTASGAETVVPGIVPPEKTDQESVSQLEMIATDSVVQETVSEPQTKIDGATDDKSES